MTLAAWLRSWSDDQLTRLFERRPDLATPPPPDFDVLAARLEIRVSVLRALDTLDTFALEVCAALTLLPRPVPVARLSDLCGGLDVTGVVTNLRALGLVWGPDNALHLVGTVVDVVGPRPLGLGRPARDCLRAYRHQQLARLASNVGLPAPRGGQDTAAGRDTLVTAISARLGDPVAVRTLIAECSPGAHQILDRLAEGPPRGSTAEAGRLLTAEMARTPVEELLARGLLVGIDTEEVELPREVGLVLRGERPTGPLHPDPPAVAGRAVAPSSVDPAAALAAETVLRQVTTLLETWGTTPVTPLRTGGLSVRDLRAAARLLEVSEHEAAFVIELAAAAGLVDASAGVDVQFVPTTAYDRWGVDLPARRWAVLVEGWVRSHTVSSLVGERDERGRQIAALSLDVRRAGASATRAEVLAALAAAPEGVAPTPDDVRALIAWRAPRRGGALLDRLVDATIREAELLGLTGRGAPAATGRLLAELLASPSEAAGSFVDALADTLAPTLPEPVDELLLQADLTAVAPGPLVPEVAAEIALLADVESTGAATVYRFSEDSLRRAFDAGATPQEIHDLLHRLARGRIPQGLTYLVDDTARRHGRLRSGPAESYLRCDDPVLLSEVLVSRRTQALGLRRIAPTVVISRLPVAQLLDGLRAAGFAPAAEGPDGRVVVSKPEAHRTPARARAAADPVAARRGQLRDAVRLVRRGDENARALHLAGAGAGALAAGSAQVAGAVRSAPLILVRLQNAVRERHRVLLGYVDAQGTASDRIVRPTALDRGYLTAFDETTGTDRSFVLHRVTAVADIVDPFALPGPGKGAGAVGDTAL